MCYEPIDNRLFANNSRVNKLILNPVFIDVKEGRARAEERQHVSKIQGGYPVSRLVGTTDIPRYREIVPVPSMHKPSTHDKPSGSSFGEWSRNNHNVQNQQLAHNTSQPSTHDKPSGSPFGERSRVKYPPLPNDSSTKVIDDSYYSAKASVFNRLGFIKPVSRKISPNPTNEATTNRINHQSGYQSIRRKVCFSTPRSRKSPRSMLHITHGIRIRWAR